MVKKEFSDILFKADLGLLSYTNSQPQYFMPENVSNKSPWTTSSQNSTYYSSSGLSETTCTQPNEEDTILPSTTDETSQDNQKADSFLFNL